MFDDREGPFTSFGGVAQEVLADKARVPVAYHHDVAMREVRFNGRLLAVPQF